MSLTPEDAKQIRNIMELVKSNLTVKYGMRKEALMNKGKEATDLIVSYLVHLGLDAKPKQVYVLYQNIKSCTDTCFVEHWITELVDDKRKLYLDVTLEQFQRMFDLKLPRIWVGNKLPTFLLSRKPGKVTLEKCGWTDLQKTGSYKNNFEYKLNR